MARTTKAKEALAEAQEWIDAAKEEVAERETALAISRQKLEMHQTIYAVLEKTFTRQSKKSTEKPAAKKKRTRATTNNGGSSKSPRASNLAATLGKNLAQQREAATKDIAGETDAPELICDTCGNISGYVDHFQPSPSYHPFTVKGVAQAAGAGD